MQLSSRLWAVIVSAGPNKRNNLAWIPGACNDVKRAMRLSGWSRFVLPRLNGNVSNLMFATF